MLRHITAFVLGVFLLLASGNAMAGFCTTAAKAPQAKMKNPHVKQALAVWQKVSSPFVAMTGRQTGLVILSKKATQTIDGKRVPFKAEGRTCPGAPPVVYITWSLMEKIYIQKTYPEDFLAFVMGHELGHRVNDMTLEGSIAGQKPQKLGQLNIEALADKRAAFFASLAGYSMSSLAKKDTVNAFLKVEHRAIPRGILDERKFALNQTLKTFEAYEHLYETGVALTFSTESNTAERLLALTDELLTGKTVPLPEIKIIRAYALMNLAAPYAPWLLQARGKLSDIETLRCAPIFPQHTKLWPDINPQVKREQGNLRGSTPESTLKKQAAARLKLARKLLDQAEEYQISAFVLNHARACLALYRDRPGVAKKAHTLAQQTALAKRGLNASIAKAVKHNRALIDFAQYLNTNAIPPNQQKAKAKRWAKGLKKAVQKTHKDNAQLAALMPLYTMYPASPRLVSRPKKAATCEAVKKQNPKTQTFQQMRMPTSTGKLGQCPAGWKRLHAIPQPNATKSQMGITTCVPIKPSKLGKLRFVAISLPGSMSPKLPKIEMSMLFRDTPNAQQTILPQATCGCTSKSYQGVSDTGQSVYRLICPQKGLVPGLVYVTPQQRVARVVAIALPEIEDEEDEDDE